MPLSNACFISFRHGERELTQRFVREFYDGLAGELEAQLGREVGVFLDQKRLQGGDFFNEQIASDLCASSCFVMIYTPAYFSLAHSYCAQEYKAMVQLEGERLALIQGDDRNRGLIIPVVLRGPNRIPNEIKNARQFYDFSEFILTDTQMSAHSKYAPQLKTMGEYIAERHRALCQVVNPDCDGFSLPSFEEIQYWLSTVIPQNLGLPGRTND
jgi:hypothetical protein